MGLLASVAFVLLNGFLMQSQSPAVSPPPYLLGPEDVISVDVLRHPEFSAEYIIPPNGSIELLFGGSIKATGVSVTDLASQIRTRLKSRLLKPEVTVSLKIMRINRFYVLGDVKVSGVYDLKPGWGIAEALSSASGLLQDTQAREAPTGLQQRDFAIRLEHVATGKVVEMPLDQALQQSDNPDLKIQPGDILRVTLLASFPVYVTGKVRAPGMYRVRADSVGLLAVIAQAGGTPEDASIKNVRVIHANGQEEVADLSPDLVLGQSTKLPSVGSGDMVIVPDLISRFSILGYVNRPGFYPMLDGHTYQLSDAVSYAGGASRRGRLARVGIIRTVNGVQQQRIYDVGRFLHKGDLTQNPTIVAGDMIYVPETNAIDASSIIGGIAAAALVYYYTK